MPRRSGDRKARTEPYTIPAAASTSRTSRRSSTGSGNFSSVMMKPQIAVFDTTPESTAVTSIGASRYVSGSQPCSGKIGALIAKAMAKPRKIQTLSLGPDSRSENVPCVTPKATTDASMRSEPTIV